MSNWALETYGPSYSGSYKKPNSPFSISIYKNWVYVHDSRIPDPDSYKVIMTIKHGSIRFDDIDIEVSRYKGQQAVFLMLSRFDEEIGHREFYGGIGCYNYRRGKEVWVLPETRKAWKTWAVKTQPYWEGKDKWLNTVCL